MHRFAAPFVLAIALAGCPAPSETTDAASPRDAASIDAAVLSDDTSVSPGEDAPVLLDAPMRISETGADAPAADAPTADAPTADAPRADAPGAFTVELVDPYAYGNCFMGPPDPLTLFWNLRVTGPAAARVTIDGATLRIQNAARSYDETQTLTLTDSSFVIPGSGTLEQEIRKESGTPSIPICTFCADMVTGELEVVVSVDGAGTQTVRASLADVGCVF